MKPQRIRRWALTGGVIGAFVLAGLGAPTARAAEPIRIGFGMALTGGLSANGKPALLAVQIWKDDVNKRGGLLGRPVELVYYDDQTNPATVPGIYTKLLDVDKVDLVISGYGTNLIAPLMPIAMERKLTIMGMFGLANNEKYQYPNYFQIQPAGPDPQTSTAIGFFELAAKQTPRPQTVAIVGADAEYPQNALVGARELIKKFGFKTVYDRTYPPSTVDYTPIVRAIKATKSLDQQKLADYLRATEFNTVVGKVKFGKNGEWAKGRTLMVQYQKVHGTGIDQFRGPGKKVVLYPEELRSGAIVYPYAAAKN